MREGAKGSQKDWFQRPELQALLDRLRGMRYPLLVVLAGLILLVWPGAPASGQREKTEQPDGSASSYDLEALEMRLSRSLSSVEGVGRAEVILTLSALSREVLAENESRRGEDWERTAVVLQGADREETTVTTQVLAPSFQGALVVCDGGGSAGVRLEVTRAVSALTGLGADRITVCARTGGRKS